MSASSNPLPRIWAVAINTFREAARIRVLYGILVLVVASNLLALVMGEMSIREESRVARDVGLAGISLFGSLTAIFLGVFLLYSEVQRRTVHSIVSKSIERWAHSQIGYSRHEQERMARAGGAAFKDRLRRAGLMPLAAGALAYARAGGPLRGGAALRYAYERVVFECLLAMRLLGEDERE